MLSYAFRTLNNKEYNKIGTEEFENTSELFSEIIIIAMNKQIKQGLFKEYIEIDETTSSIKGKINISESINSQSFLKRQLNCSYDEFSTNSYLNRIIKTTISILLILMMVMSSLVAHFIGRPSPRTSTPINSAKFCT